MTRNELFWRGLLPNSVAMHQAAYERRHALLRAVETGANVRQLAKRLGTSPTAVYVKLDRASQDRMRNAKAPVIRFCGIYPAVACL